MKFKNLDRASPNRTRHQEGYVPLHSFLGDVASPVSIKARSLHALDQLLNSTSHMLCIWGTVNRRNLQYRQIRIGVFLTGRDPLFEGKDCEQAESCRFATVRK